MMFIVNAFFGIIKTMYIQVFDSSLEKFISKLDKFTIAKILRTIDLLERFGRNLGLPHSKKVRVERKIENFFSRKITIRLWNY